MAKHEITIRENTGATKASAPYLGNYVSKGTLALADYIDAIAADCGLSAIQTEAMLTGAFDAIIELEKEGLVRVNTDVGAVCGVITGSFATADAAFDPDVNALDLVVRLDDDIRNLLADTTPSIVTDQTTTKVRLDNVADETTPRPYNLIHGVEVFRAAGINLVTTDDGYEAWLEDAHETKYPVLLVEAVSNQLVRCRASELLEGGDYKLYVTSRGGDAEGPLQTVARKVKVLKVEPTEPVALGFGMERAKLSAGNMNYVRGYCLTADWSKDENYLIANFKSKNMPSESMCQITGTNIVTDMCNDKQIEFKLDAIIDEITREGYSLENGEEFPVNVQVMLGDKHTDVISFTAEAE